VDEVTVNGVKLAYRVHGAAGAPPMVLLHGLGDDERTWDPVVADLARTHRVYGLDLRGHGASAFPGRYSFELMRDDVVAFCAELGLDRIVLIGHSLGGTVAWLVAEERPELVSHLIVVDTPPPRPGDPPVPRRVRPDRPLPYDWRAVEAITAQLNDPDPAWWDRAATVALPTLIVAGGKDSTVDQKRLKALAERVPGAKLVTVKAGHHAHKGRPKEFVDAVRAFLG
jgi:pimeloyl-ACP methyl ester carboxylesterase